MKINRPSRRSSGGQLDSRLTAYLATAGAVGVAATADEAAAVVVRNYDVQPFGINQEVDIDFNSDGQIDFQIDHDRVDVNGNDVDYLQVDKNDINGAANPLDFDPLPGFAPTTFPPNGTTPNNGTDAGYVVSSGLGDYPSNLGVGDLIGADLLFDYQEGADFNATGRAIRANRLIDEDNTQIDQVLGGLTAAQVFEPTNGPNWLGLNGDVGYLGLRMQLNGDAFTYGWVGVRITDEADATGEVVGWAYQTNGGPIGAGVPEPTSLLMTLIGGAAITFGYLWRRVRGS